MASATKLKFIRKGEYLNGEQAMTEAYFTGPGGAEVRLALPSDSFTATLQLGKEYELTFTDLAAAGTPPAAS